MLLIKKYFHVFYQPFLLVLLVSSHTNFAAQFPGAGAGMPFAGDDLAAQAEFNKILEELEQMPEDKLQELEQQLQAEVKRELEQMSPERRKEFDREMAEFWRSQGVDPNQLPSLDDMLGLAPTEGAGGATIQTPAMPTQTETAPKEFAPTEHTAREVEEMLGQLLRNLESLRHKMSAHPNMVRKLQAWKEAIDDLVYYLKIMDTPEHHERLITKDYANLLKHLKTLQKELASAEPRFLSALPKKESSEDPYDILRVDPTATDKEIQDAYTAYVKENDPAALRAKLTAEGFDENDIEGRVKSARLNMRTVKEAYEKISNPKIRAQTDRALAATQEQSQAGQEHSQGALNALINALSQAIYQKNVLEDIQRFMKKYEPVKLEQRKKMEEAEQKRRKEQAEAGKLKPTPGTSASYEPYYLPGGPSYQTTSGGGYPSYGGGYGNYGREPQYGPGGGASFETPKAPSSGGGSGGRAGSTDKKDEKKDGKEAPKSEKKDDDKKKKLADEWTKAAQTVSRELDLLHSDVIVRDSHNPEDPLRAKINGVVKAVADAQIAAGAAPAIVEPEAEAAPDAEEVAPEEPVAVEPDANPEHVQAITAFIEGSPRTENLQKAFKDLAKLTEKAAEEKVKLPTKDKMLDEIQNKPAYAMLASLGQIQAPPALPARSRIAGASPKASKLFEHLNRFNEVLAPAE